MNRERATDNATTNIDYEGTTHETPADGNVFLDLGFDPEEAANLKVRSTLMMEVENFIEKRELTQQQAADLMGVTQPRVSDLVRGKIELFSVDGLIGMLSRAGLRVEVRVEAAKEAA